MAASKSSAGRSRTSSRNRSTKARGGAAKADGLAGLAEQLANRILKPLGLVVLSREKIQETLDEAAERGRLTRSDANALVAELVRLGRQQTDELLSDLERLLGRGAAAWTRRPGAQASEPLDRIVRGADRHAARSGVGTSFPILGYDESDRGSGPGAARWPVAGGAAQGSRLRAPAREPQVGAGGDRESAPLSGRRAGGRRQAATRRSARADGRLAGVRRRGRGAHGRLRGVRPGRGARRPRPRARPQVQARVRPGPRRGDPRAVPDRIDPSQSTPGPRGRCSATSASSRSSRSRSATRCAGSAGSRVRARADRSRARSSGATATSSSTRSARGSGRQADVRLPCPGPLGRDRRGDRRPARLGGGQRGSRADRAWCREQRLRRSIAARARGCSATSWSARVGGPVSSRQGS